MQQTKKIRKPKSQISTAVLIDFGVLAAMQDDHHRAAALRTAAMHLATLAYSYEDPRRLAS